MIMRFKKKLIIKNKDGDVFRFLRNKEIKKYSEIYFSEILPNKFKGWTKNKYIDQNIIVPIGNIKVTIIENIKKKKIKTVLLGKKFNYGIYKINKNTWYGFKCLGKQKALIVNCISEIHNRKNIENMSKTFIKIRS